MFCNWHSCLPAEQTLNQNFNSFLIRCIKLIFSLTNKNYLCFKTVDGRNLRNIHLFIVQVSQCLCPSKHPPCVPYSCISYIYIYHYINSNSTLSCICIHILWLRVVFISSICAVILLHYGRNNILQFHSNLSRNSLKLIILCGFGLSPTNTQRGSTEIICSQYQALTTRGDYIQQCKSTTTEILSQESDLGFIFPKRIFKLLCN